MRPTARACSRSRTRGRSWCSTLAGQGMIASASEDKMVKVWDATTGQATLTLKGHAGYVMGVSFSPDGTRIASASSDQTVKVWDAATDQETLTLEGHVGDVRDVCFSPDGTRIASASHEESVKVAECCYRPRDAHSRRTYGRCP